MSAQPELHVDQPGNAQYERATPKQFLNRVRRRTAFEQGRGGRFVHGVGIIGNVVVQGRTGVRCPCSNSQGADIAPIKRA